MAKAILYVRCSTAEQAKSGLGLEHQTATLQAEAERRGWDVLEVIADKGESGSSLDRPGFRKAMQALADGRADVLAVTKLDRLSRSVLDFATLLEWFSRSEASLVALDLNIDTSTPAGRLVANVFASVAEWERDTIAARTSDALHAKRARGERLAPAVVDRPEVVERIQELREAGLSLRAIADQLTADGVPTARGAARWQVSAVQAAAGYKRPQAARKAADLPEPRPVRRRRTAKA